MFKVAVDAHAPVPVPKAASKRRLGGPSAPLSGDAAVFIYSVGRLETTAPDPNSFLGILLV